MLLFSRFGMSRAGKAIVAGPSMPTVTGPGPSTLAYGDVNMGFFGEVASTSFISGSALASAVGLTAGTLINDTTVWLKFILDGQIMFIPKTNIRHSATWQDIYQAGAVYGDSTYGTFPAGSNRLQNAAVTVGGKQFTVKLLAGSTGDNAVGTDNGYDIPISRGSEWSRLFYPLSTTAVASAPTPKWNLYTDTQLDISGRYSWCRDKSSLGAIYRVIRGSYDVSRLARYSVTNASSNCGWRPCLTLQ